jgi:hypothetical protein
LTVFYGSAAPLQVLSIINGTAICVMIWVRESDFSSSHVSVSIVAATSYLVLTINAFIAFKDQLNAGKAFAIGIPSLVLSANIGLETQHRGSKRITENAITAAHDFLVDVLNPGLMCFIIRENRREVPPNISNNYLSYIRGELSNGSRANSRNSRKNRRAITPSSRVHKDDVEMGHTMHGFAPVSPRKVWDVQY